MNSAYYLLSISSEKYDNLQKNRIVSIPSGEQTNFEKGDLFLIYLKDVNMLFAEYDLENYKIKEDHLELNLEPIYNSPLGLQLTDLMLLVLPTHPINEWKELLNGNLVGLSENDYNELVTRLKL